jgi:multidrug efflux pump subunit AcrA (membrane-fusion protein)
VEAEDLRWIDRDRPVSFTSREIPGQWKGKIVRTGSDIDTRTQTVEVYVSVENSSDAAPLNGTFLEARLAGQSVDDAFVIPPKALYEDRYVYLIVEGKLARRNVTMLRREANRIIIDSGLNEGDTLVVEAMQGIAEGMPAWPKSSDPLIRRQ